MKCEIKNERNNSLFGFQTQPKITMKKRFDSFKAQAGRIPLVLLWLVGVPVPILIIIFLFRGCSGG